jgi:hypothetical protein
MDGLSEILVNVPRSRDIFLSQIKGFRIVDCGLRNVLDFNNL